MGRKVKKEVQTQANKKYYLKNREAQLRRAKEYYIVNKDKIREKNKGYYERNVDRLRKFNNEYYHAHKERHRERQLRYKFDMSLQEYDEMFMLQGRRCAICRIAKAGGRHGVFVVDHCHETGRVRGLLCCACNHGLGKFGDDPERLKAAIDYLYGGW